MLVKTKEIAVLNRLILILSTVIISLLLLIANVHAEQNFNAISAQDTSINGIHENARHKGNKHAYKPHKKVQKSIKIKAVTNETLTTEESQLISPPQNLTIISSP